MREEECGVDAPVMDDPHSLEIVIQSMPKKDGVSIDQ
jgi:hypothetical protein